MTYLKGVLFGPPKSGKTKAAVTGGKTLLVEMEPEGDLSLRRHPELSVDVVRPSSHEDLEEIIRGLATTEAGRWDTVTWDSVTFMMEMLGGKDIMQTLRENRDVRRAYGKAGAAVNQIISDAVKLPMNVIFTSQIHVDNPGEEGEVENPEEGQYPVSLAVTPMVYKILVPAVSFIGRTYKKNGLQRNGKVAERVVEYWTSFEDYGRSPAGKRIDIPDQVQNLDLSKLLADIKGGS